MTEQILVPFAGQGSGVGELSWGQREIWLLMTDQLSSLSIGQALPLAAGTTTAGVAADLQFLMGRHASLRTRLSFAADGHPRQVVAESGEVPLLVTDAGDADPGEVAAALCHRFVEKIFDYSAEWPVRWAVVLSRGIATHLVFVVCHLAADGHGVAAMMADLRCRADGTQPVTALQPLDQARLQSAAASQRRSAGALRHWERVLRAAPARRFAGPADPRRPRYWQACYDSPASHLAVQAIALRTGTSTSTVLLAAFAVVMSRLTGTNPAVVQVVVSNRFRAGLADSVSPVNQAGLCVIDVADVTFDEAVARTWRSAMAGYKFAYYDPLAREHLIERVGGERGGRLDIDCSVNDRRMSSRLEPDGAAPDGSAPDGSAPDGSAPDGSDVRAALPRSVLTWGFQRDRPTGRCFLLIDDVPDTVFYELCADTHVVSPANMEACLRGMEAVAVGAALDPAARTGIQSALLNA